MADTSNLEEAFEWTREELRRRFGVAFSKRKAPLAQGTLHTFNAVAEDGSVVATISHSSGLTSGGKKPVGKIHSAISYLYFLSQARAKRRVLVLTDPVLCELVKKEVEGALAEGIEILQVNLPKDLVARVRNVTDQASDEMS